MKFLFSFLLSYNDKSIDDVIDIIVIIIAAVVILAVSSQ